MQYTRVEMNLDYTYSIILFNEVITRLHMVS